MEAIVNAIVDGATACASGAMDAVTGVLPVAMPVIAAGLVITIGIKTFKRVTGKA